MEPNILSNQPDPSTTSGAAPASVVVSPLHGRVQPRPDASDPCSVRSVAIVGAGMMGTAIAAANVRLKVPVFLTDADEETRLSAAARIAAELRPDGQPVGHETEAAVNRLVATTTDLRILGQCGLVLESIVESLPAKQELYARLEPQLGRDTLLASNTSTIPVTLLASKLADPRRFLGLHFFHPVRSRPLVEIIRGPATSDRTVAAAASYVKAIEKTPLVVNDGSGFVVNRLLAPYLAEAMELLLDGVAIHEIESAAKRFGMAMGPFRLIDEIGLDTALLGGRVLWEAFPDRVTPSPLLISMYKSGRLGRKTGAGFFSYPPGRDGDAKGQLAPGVGDLIAAWARTPAPVAPDRIMVRLLLPMVLEATRILEERLVDGPASVDLAVVLGLGFPAARGGLLRWADSLGPQRILAMLEGLTHLGPRVQPTPLLEEMARRRRGFHPRAA